MLDPADERIVELLMGDGRMSNRALAAEVGLSEVTVASRIRSLQDRRLLGVSVLLDWQAAGYAWDLTVAVSVDDRPVAEVAEDLAGVRYVHWVMQVVGAADVMLHVQAPDRAAVVELLTHDLPQVAGIRRTDVQVNLDTLKYEVQFAKLPLAPSELDFPAPVVDLDDLDRSIIDGLVADGRRSNRDLARRLGVADGTIRSRIARLSGAGLLRICAQTDPYRTGRVGAWAYAAIDVDGADTAGVGRALAALDDVLIVNLCSGPTAFTAFVVARDRATLIDHALPRIRGIPGVRGVALAEVVRTVKLDYRWARLIERT